MLEQIAKTLEILSQLAKQDRLDEYDALLAEFAASLNISEKKAEWIVEDYELDIEFKKSSVEAAKNALENRKVQIQ